MDTSVPCSHGHGHWREAIFNSTLPANAKLTALALSVLSDADGRASPTISALTMATSLGASSVKGALSALLKAGFIVGDRSRGRTASQYELVIPAATQPVTWAQPCVEQPVRLDQPATMQPVNRPNFDQPDAGQPVAHIVTTNLPTIEKGSSGLAEMVAACGEALALSPSHEQVALQWLKTGFSLEHIITILKARSAGKPVRSIVSWRYFESAIRETPQLPVADRPRKPQRAEPAQPASKPSITPTPTQRDPWSYRAKEEARSLLQSPMGRRAAGEGWIQALYDFARGLGRLPVDSEIHDVRTSGLEFSRKIACDHSPLAKAARKRIEALRDSIGFEGTPAARADNVVALRPRTRWAGVESRQ